MLQPQTRAMKRRLEQSSTSTKNPTKKRNVWPAETKISDLPIEMILMILENLTLNELVNNSSRTCLQWRDVISQFILRPQILRLANDNGKFRRDIQEDGWTEEAQGSDFILSLYPKYEMYSYSSM